MGDQDPARIGEGRRIGDRRSRADHRQIVTGDVRDHQRGGRAIAERERELPAFDGREVLADGVHLRDGRAAREQKRHGAALVGERHAWRWRHEQARRAASEQHEHGQARTTRQGGEQPGGRRDATAIGYRVAADRDRNPVEPTRVARGHDHEAARDRGSEGRLDSGRERGGTLTGTDDEQLGVERETGGQPGGETAAARREGRAGAPATRSADDQRVAASCEDAGDERYRVERGERRGEQLRERGARVSGSHLACPKRIL